MPNWKEYWKDDCPICGELAIEACRCLLNDRECKNEHIWRRHKDNSASILDKMHGEEIERIQP